ncbi:MAG: DUF935 family protein [Verrucomicrobia bacterium]|nr:MAG: DUF935 family protein [Verrucomicrobiota bacterium]
MPAFPLSLKRALKQIIPTRRVTLFDVRALPVGLARTLDVDRVAHILEAAEAGRLEELFRLYRDIIATSAHLQGRFADRKRAVIGDTLDIQPFDKKAAADRLAADAIQQMIEEAPAWEDAINHLLESTLYPVAVVEKVFRPIRRRYRLAELVIVPHDLLDFSEGALRIKDTDPAGRPLGTSHPADPARYIIARIHTLSLPDQWGGPLRSLVFWWLLATMDREWWARFLDKYGAPFMVGRYDQADDASRSILERAFSLATRLGGLVVSRDTEVEIRQASSSDSAAAFEAFHRICNAEISKLILGQTLSADAAATGLGSGVAKSQAAVRDDIRQADGRRLANILRRQLFTQYLHINGIPGRAPIPVWGSVSTEETTATGALLQSLALGGLRVSDDGLDILSERLGLPIERSQPPQTPLAALNALAADGRAASDSQILRAASADLARTLGQDFAPIAELILRSRSPADAMARVEAFCARFDAHRSARIVEETLLAFAANGATSPAR